MPELVPLLERVDGRPADDQDPEEQLDAARAIVAAFGSDPREER